MNQSSAPSPEKVDAIVIGGGVTGLLTALELCHRKLTVRLVERDFSGPPRTHIGEMTLLGGDTEIDGLFNYSLKCWRETSHRYGLDLGLAQRGALDLSTSYGRTLALASETASDVRSGFTVTMVANAEAVAGHAGVALGPVVQGAKWWAEAPVISTHTVLETLRRELTVRGVLIWGQDEVKELLTEGTRVTGIRLASGETSLAPHIIVTAGALAGNLVKTIGAHLPLRPNRTHLLTLSAPDGLGFPMLVHRLRRGHLWMKRLREGPVLVAYDGLMDPTQATFSTQVDERLVSALRQHIGTLVPSLASASLTQTSVVTGAVTPDFRPAIGPWAGVEGLHLATGFGARNYAFAAGAARLLGMAIAGEATALSLGAFAPGRFASGQWQKISHPPSLSWKESVAPQPGLVESRIQPEFANNVQMVGKPDAHYASDVRQTEKKLITAASTQQAKEPDRRTKGRIQTAAVR